MSLVLNSSAGIQYNLQLDNLDFFILFLRRRELKISISLCTCDSKVTHFRNLVDVSNNMFRIQGPSFIR